MSTIAWQRSWTAERRLPPAWTLAALLALAYVAIVPGGGDLAAQSYRAHLGPVLWDNGWYGGHQMPAYSLLFPPLGSLLGVRVTGAVAAVAAAYAFERLAIGHWGERARAGTLFFALGTAANLVSGRMTFSLGLALGLGALLAASRDRAGTAVALALLTAVATPVAAAFLGLAGLAWWIVERRPLAVAVGAAAVLPALALMVLFPEGGRFPFAAPSFWPALPALAGVLIALPREDRVLRSGVVLAALATIASFLIANPLGGNVIRLATIAAGPLVVCGLWGRGRPWMLVLFAVPLLWWQWAAPVRDWTRAAGDPSVHEAYYAGMLAFLDDQAARGGPFRVEVPFTQNHWEARWVAASHPLARGWLRQLDTVRNPLFYDGRRLTPARYRAWLRENAVRFVALPDTRLDRSARAEAQLVRAGIPGVRRVWGDRHWRVFAVDGARPLAGGAARAVAIDGAGVTLAGRRAGPVDLRVRFNPYWRVVRGRGCVSRAPDGWTRLRLPAAGVVRLEPSFGLDRVGRTGPRCSP